MSASDLWPEGIPTGRPNVVKLPRRKKDPTSSGGGDSGLPVIQVKNGFLPAVATEGEQVLVASAVPIYQRGGMLVRPVQAEVPASRGRTTVSAGLSPVTTAAMVDRLCRVAEWQRYDARAKDLVRIDAPTKIAETILSRNGEWTFPTIAGIITTPTIRPDGTLLTAPGYDAQTRLYHAVDSKLDLSSHLPLRPTRDDALKALADLQYLLKNFPTVAETDVSVALSALISPVVGGAVAVVPMHAFRASTAGTGKTYLVDVASAINNGRPCPVATVAQTDEETEKRVGALLMAAFPLICLDNVNGELGGDFLCQAIERPVIQIRPLGKTEIIEIETRSTIYATGNGLRVRGDMTRRTLVANLDAQMERPELREFDFDPVEEVLNDRARYVAAALTIVLAHVQAGFPGCQNLAKLGSFQDWSNHVRAALIWLGCADCCGSMEQAREEDPERSEYNELLTAWVEEIGDINAFTSAEIADYISQRFNDDHGDAAEFQHPKLRTFWMRLAMSRTGVDTRKIGNYLSAKNGQIHRKMKIIKASQTHSVVRWKLEKV